MKSFKFIATCILFLILFLSCNDKAVKHDCIFIQDDNSKDGEIDETEQAIMWECRDNLLSSKSDIENNLLGEWKLIGHGTSWGKVSSLPCGYMTITENQLTFEFKNEKIDTVSIHSWEISEPQMNGTSYFKLNVTPNDVGVPSINKFCKHYMYGNYTPSDGEMYLFQKVK